MAGTILNTPTKSRLNDEATYLRQELKIWENEHAAEHDGRKPSRDEIKKNPEMAAKYKSYNKIRDTLEGKAPQSKPVGVPFEVPTPSRKRKSADASLLGNYRTPKRQASGRNLATPIARPAVSAQLSPYDTPSRLKLLLTPADKKIIGPTPQRDGQALGLFDLMSDDEPTPVKSIKTAIHGRAAFSELVNGPAAILKTPSKACGSPYKGETPLSGRQLLDRWATPTKPSPQKRENATTERQLQFSTPSFLRRESQLESQVMDDDVISDSAPKRPRPLGHQVASKFGLTAMLSRMKKAESDALDEDLELLREIEDEEAGIRKPVENVPRKQKEITRVSDTAHTVDWPPKAVLTDSPIEDDGSGVEDVLREVSTQRESSITKKPYEKKGQKRTTRRTVMRPVKSKLAEDKRPDKLGEQADPEEKGVMAGKTAKVKKVSAQAHANYKRLKIRGQGTKRPKFGGRRR